jgi:hypothetical protein
VTEARYVLDENVAGYLLAPLRHAGIDVVSLSEVGRTGLGDPEQFTWAAASGRVTITHDRDFLRLARVVPSHAGLAFSMQQKYRDSPGALIRRIQELHAGMAAEDWENRVVFL